MGHGEVVWLSSKGQHCGIVRIVMIFKSTVSTYIDVAESASREMNVRIEVRILDVNGMSYRGREVVTSLDENEHMDLSCFMYYIELLRQLNACRRTMGRTLVRSFGNVDMHLSHLPVAVT